MHQYDVFWLFSDKMHRFWGIFVHIAKIETLREAYEISKRNGGSPGIDGLTFDEIEKSSLSEFLLEIREELINNFAHEYGSLILH